MKKSLFGYNASEVDVMLNTLREENESLNGTITTLRTQVKNSESNGAKATLLEIDIKNLEERLKLVSDEKNDLLSQIASLSQESSALNGINADLITQIELLKQQNETLNNQISDLQLQNTATLELNSKVDYSFMETLQSQLDSEKEYKVTLEKALYDKTEALTDTTTELEKAKIIIEQLKDELALSAAVTDEQAAASSIEDKQFDTQKPSADITLQAYQDMTRMRNEVLEYMHTQKREFYKLVNENSVRLNEVMEQRQTEYNKMIREFFKSATEFHGNLTNSEDMYSKMTDYSFNLDKLSNNMNEIMNNYAEMSGAYLKETEAMTDNNVEPVSKDLPHQNMKEVKPFVFKEIREKNS